MATSEATADAAPSTSSIAYRQYTNEEDLPTVMELIDKTLSEPYSIFTYRYFLHNWPQLCFLAYDGEKPFGTIVCKQEKHRDVMRGYVAMLVVDEAYRGKGAGSRLVELAVQAMISGGCEEVTLEAEVGNYGALALYQRLGFIRDKRLHKYYLNGADAYRLKLLLPLSEEEVRRREQLQLGQGQGQSGLDQLAALSLDAAASSQQIPVA